MSAGIVHSFHCFLANGRDTVVPVYVEPEAEEYSILHGDVIEIVDYYRRDDGVLALSLFDEGVSVYGNTVALCLSGTEIRPMRVPVMANSGGVRVNGDRQPGDTGGTTNEQTLIERGKEVQPEPARRLDLYRPRETNSPLTLLLGEEGRVILEPGQRYSVTRQESRSTRLVITYLVGAVRVTNVRKA